MTDKTTAAALAASQASAAALALADHAGWITEPVDPVLQREFWGYLQVPSADLLLAPARIGSAERFRANRATREARSDAALVQIGRSMQGERQVYVALGFWSVKRTRWLDSHLPFLDPAGLLWLVPMLNTLAAGDPAYQLGTGRLLPSDTIPWGSAAEYQQGLAAGRALFPFLLEVR